MPSARRETAAFDHRSEEQGGEAAPGWNPSTSRGSRGGVARDRFPLRMRREVSGEDTRICRIDSVTFISSVPAAGGHAGNRSTIRSEIRLAPHKLIIICHLIYFSFKRQRPTTRNSYELLEKIRFSGTSEEATDGDRGNRFAHKRL